MKSTAITIQTRIHASKSKVWEALTEPKHIVRWNAASEDWHTTSASVNMTIGGSFRSRMEAKDGSAGFDFEGIYSDVSEGNHYRYILGDGREVMVNLVEGGKSTDVIEIFDPENMNSRELQQQGWQAILDHLKEYIETEMDV